MINQLRTEFQKIYFSNISTTKGLEELAKNIGISKNSLRRFLGKLQDDTKLRTSTLGLIAQRIGYKNFDDFCQSIGGEKSSLDFELLEIYYGSVQGHGTTLNETRFQKANYYFAEKILSDPKNLREFVKRFAENEEALEYVLAWHPSYENIAREDYQNALLTLAKTTSKSHLQVFAYSFVYFGKFMSENLSVEDANQDLKNIEKAVVKMRKESSSFQAFPEARYVVARCIHRYLTSPPLTERRPDTSLQKLLTLQHMPNATVTERVLFIAYVTNILNILGDYENAELCFGDFLSEKKLNDFAVENPHFATHAFFYKLNSAITRYHVGNEVKALALFQTLPTDINDYKTFSFDSKLYFELEYLHFARKIYPKKREIKQRYKMLIERTNFTFLTKA